MSGQSVWIGFSVKTRSITVAPARMAGTITCEVDQRGAGADGPVVTCVCPVRERQAAGQRLGYWRRAECRRAAMTSCTSPRPGNRPGGPLLGAQRLRRPRSPCLVALG